MNDNAQKQGRDIGIKPDECALINEVAARRLAYPLAWLCMKLGMSANAVTLLGGICLMISIPLVASIPLIAHLGEGGGRAAIWWHSQFPWIVVAFLWVAGYFLDVADGSVARITKTSSRRGFFLDYVFHLLFKPAFLPALGFGLIQTKDVLYYLGLNTSGYFIAIVALSGLANWNASNAAVDHVLCDEIGKGKLTVPEDPQERMALMLPGNGITDTATSKRTSFASIAKTLLAEIFSYYGQMLFFAFTVMIDVCIATFCLFAKDRIPRFLMAEALLCMNVTFVSYCIISSVLILRVPLRIWRDYKRISLSDR